MYIYNIYIYIIDIYNQYNITISPFLSNKNVIIYILFVFLNGGKCQLIIYTIIYIIDSSSEMFTIALTNIDTGHTY